MQVLLVYYSKTGQTKKLAEAIDTVVISINGINCL